MDDIGKARWRPIRDIEVVVDVGVLLVALAATGLDGEHAGDEHMLLRSLVSLKGKEEVGRGDALGWRRIWGNRGIRETLGMSRGFYRRAGRCVWCGRAATVAMGAWVAELP